jgi:hypothetical protein
MRGGVWTGLAPLLHSVVRIDHFRIGEPVSDE